MHLRFPSPREAAAALAAAILLVATLAPATARAQPAPSPEPPVQAQPPSSPSWPPQEWLGRTLELPTKWLVDALTGSIAAVGQTILQAVQKDVDWALGRDGRGANFVAQTPPANSYESPSVRSLYETVRRVANVGLGLAGMWAGYQVMAGGRSRGAGAVQSALELAPRLALGALLVNTSLWWGQLAIDFANALGSVAGPVDLPGRAAATDIPLVLELVLVGLVYWLVCLLLVLQQLMRLALVDVLLVLAPLGMLLWVLPQTQSWHRLWSDLFLATVFAQPVQMLVLKLGTLLVGELGGGGPLVSMFLAMAVAYLVLKVPGMLRGGLVRGGGGMGVGVLAASTSARQAGRTAGVSR